MKKSLTILLTGLIASASLVAAAQQQAPSKMPDTGRRKITYPGFNKVKTFGGRQQFSEYSIGVNAGVLMPFSPLGGKTEFAKPSYKFGYAAFLKWQIQHSFGLRLDYMGGMTGGHTAPQFNSAFPAGAGSDVSVKTKIQYAASVKLEVAVASIDFLRRKDAVRAFVTAGYGYAGFKPTVSSASAIYTVNNGMTVNSGFIPVGVGFKFRLSEGLALNLGYDLYLFNAGNLYVPAGTSSSPSKLGFGYGGLEYTFGGARAKSLIWNNPVAVMYDELKNNDSLEHVIDSLKQGQTGMQTTIDKLSKDSDNDGVSDAFDKCPNTVAGTKVDGSGCDLPVAVNTTTQIQPVIIQQDIEVVRAAVRNLTFENNSTIISQSSDSSLNRLATLLVSKPNLHLKLTGYTDNVGKKAANQRLSAGRANAVKEYLTGKGASADQITAKGMGPVRPIASNKTATGRAKNRRVEFNLY